jgi:intein/homing endonuclease
MANILLGCEESQAVTKAFRELGMNAYSCDLVPCTGGHPEWHLQIDIFEAIQKEKWDLMIAFPPCFVGDTLITTYNGLIPIKDIKIGDMVLTHEGRWKNVTEVMSKKVDKVRYIKSSNSIDTYTTDDHPFFVKEKIKKNQISEPRWLDAKYLNTSCYTGFVQIPQKKYYKEIDDELLWLMGRYVADGYMRKNRRRPGKYEYLNICVGKHKLKLFEDHIKKYKYNISEQRTVYKIGFSNWEFLENFKDFGLGAKNKKIPIWILELPTYKLSIFLNGYLSGDGHFEDDKISASTISKELAIGLCDIFSKVFKLAPSINVNRRKTGFIEGRKVNINPLYTISIRTSTASGRRRNHIDENYMWGGVIKNEEIYSPDTIVYNLSVADDESYIANNCIVHNCTFLAGSGARWLYNKDGTTNVERHQKRSDALNFVSNLMSVDIPRIAIENPVGAISTHIRKPDQIIQPWMFGDSASKTTCLWLKNLPLLIPTNVVDKGEFFEFQDRKTGKLKKQPMWYYKALSNTKTKAERQTLRSKTFPGIANAIASQWSAVLND